MGKWWIDALPRLYLHDLRVYNFVSWPVANSLLLPPLHALAYNGITEFHPWSSQNNATMADVEYCLNEVVVGEVSLWHCCYRAWWQLDRECGSLRLCQTTSDCRHSHHSEMLVTARKRLSSPSHRWTRTIRDVANSWWSAEFAPLCHHRSSTSLMLDSNICEV